MHGSGRCSWLRCCGRKVLPPTSRQPACRRQEYSAGAKACAQSLRLLAFVDAIRDAALAGLKEHDRLTMARKQMERRLRERRANSKLPDLVELVLSRPVVSTALIQERLKISKQGALNLVGELGLREMTGRERAWGM
ncbi:DUF1612 and helix-turn-helix domain-containing protein [Mesorhizobium sp. M0340]|uniref:helix-turn-helix domain-containing protein n=1 Tax=Mesorhizobium sp. M0340 TaxID=2956939 RepID=UPI00333660EB